MLLRDSTLVTAPNAKRSTMGFGGEVTNVEGSQTFVTNSEGEWEAGGTLLLLDLAGRDPVLEWILNFKIGRDVFY